MTQHGKTQPWVVPPGRSSLLTYELYYGLKEKPFSLSPDPRFLYKSHAHAPTFDDLHAGILRREGLIVLTGDIGTGKTTLCRAVLENLDRKTFSTFVPDPFVSREDLLKMLLIDFGVMSVDDVTSGRLSHSSRAELSYPLYEFLKSLVPLQAFAVLIIDEAQNLSSLLLEEIRILSDLEAQEKLLQVVLVGQLEFRTKLKLPEMRQVDQRVSVRCQLDPLSCDAVFGYVAHRLAVAGGAVDRVSFSSEAIDEVYEASHGVPRLINLVCDRALHYGHLSRAARIDADLVKRALRDLGVGDLTEPEPATASPALPAQMDFRISALPESKPSDITMDHDDLLNAAHVKIVDPSEPEPAQWASFNRTLLVDTPASWAVGAPALRKRMRRRTRRLLAVAAAGVLLAVGWAGVNLIQAQLAEETRNTIMPSLPEPPPLRIPQGLVPTPSEPVLMGPEIQTIVPPENFGGALGAGTGVYVIGVALFESPDRATRLVGSLLSDGYKAYQTDLDLGARGRMYEVLVGPYSTRAGAEVDLANIRDMPGYQDSRLVLPNSSR